MHPTVKLFILAMIVEFLLVANYSEGRYLPTRGHSDNLEKLRELMYQILESSDENQNEQQRVPFNHRSWSRQNQADGDLPKLFGSSKTRFGGGQVYDTDRLYS